VKEQARRAIGEFLIRLYFADQIWRGIKRAQEAGIEVISAATIPGGVTVWSPDTSEGPGIEIRLKGGR